MVRSRGCPVSRTEEALGPLTLVRTSWPSGLQELTCYAGPDRLLVGVAEQQTDGQWVLCGETPARDRYYATFDGCRAAMVRAALATTYGELTR